jgi:hypothetical protein
MQDRRAHTIRYQRTRRKSFMSSGTVMKERLDPTFPRCHQPNQYNCVNETLLTLSRARRGRARARTNFCPVRLRKNQRFHHPMFDRPVYSKHTINDVRIYRRYHSRHLQIKKAGTFFPLSKKSPSAQREKLSATWTEREPQRKAS